MATSDPALTETRKRLVQAKALAVLTGAGISADSGVPTFRGPEGLWRNFRAEELATPEAFSKDPRLVWEWYNWRRELIATKFPNPAHHALVALEKRLPTFMLITQNVDGLHAQAGSRRLIEIHGNIWKVRCTGCEKVSINREVPLPLLPSCSQCGGLLRPHVVWFGEPLDAADIQQSIEALKSCDTMLVIGTSRAVQPAASFADLAKSAGAFVVEINTDPEPHPESVDVVIPGRAAEILPQLL